MKTTPWDEARRIVINGVAYRVTKMTETVVEREDWRIGLPRLMKRLERDATEAGDVLKGVK